MFDHATATEPLLIVNYIKPTAAEDLAHIVLGRGSA